MKEAAVPSVGWSYHSSSINQKRLEVGIPGEEAEAFTQPAMPVRVFSLFLRPAGNCALCRVTCKPPMCQPHVRVADNTANWISKHGAVTGDLCAKRGPRTLEPGRGRSSDPLTKV